MRRFFIEPHMISGHSATITGSDARHIRTVLRLKPNDEIALFDGSGWAYHAGIEAIDRDEVAVSIRKRFPEAGESPLAITVAQGFLKEKKMDRLVRQLTELGARGWMPFYASRSVARPEGKRLAARVARWQKIAREAVKQCGRGRIPDIAPAVSFEALLAGSASFDLKILFWERADGPIADEAKAILPITGTAMIILGPEGGLTDEEAEKAETAGFRLATLGPRILKAETAAVAACALVQYLFGDLSTKPAEQSPARE